MNPAHSFTGDIIFSNDGSLLYNDTPPPQNKSVVNLEPVRIINHTGRLPSQYEARPYDNLVVIEPLRVYEPRKKLVDNYMFDFENGLNGTTTRVGEHQTLLERRGDVEQAYQTSYTSNKQETMSGYESTMIDRNNLTSRHVPLKYLSNR